MKTHPARRWLRAHRLLMVVLAAALLLPIAARATIYAFDDQPRSWSQANWSSIGSLPEARMHPDARVLVLTARTGGWRGVFAVHSWIVLKPESGDRWMRYDVVGWGSPIRTNGWAPDGRWRGNDPIVVADVRGAEAERLIPRIEAAVQGYRATIARGRGRTATHSSRTCCARCRSLRLRCQVMRSGATTGQTSTPGSRTAGPASS
jgi:hypothetical protein